MRAPEEPALAAHSTRRIAVAPWLYALALGLWAASWNLRLSVLMAWLPVEPVWAFSAAVALCFVHRVGQPLRMDLAVVWPVALLTIAFLPGALRSSGDGFAPTKLATMIFIVLPVFCAATLLLDSREVRLRWFWVQALLGVAVATATLKFSDPANLLEPGRFTLATVDTIWAARLAGVALVAMVLVTLAAPRHAAWALPFAAVSGVVLVRIGSRGPFLFALISVVIVLLMGRCFAGRRAMYLVIALAIGGGASFYASVHGGSGGRRIVDSLHSGLADPVRSQLLGDAVRLGKAHLMGIGWGDFAHDSFVGSQLANAQGDSYAHNLVAETFAEGGIFAVGAVIAVMVVALIRLWRLSDDPYQAALLGTFVFWVLNAQVSSDIIGNRFMFISLACALAACGEPNQPGRMALPETAQNIPSASSADGSEEHLTHVVPPRGMSC